MHRTNSNYIKTHDRYSYQGSEMDDEVKGDGNSYTTTFRQLDPRLGRWLTIDPLAGEYSWQSPYCSMDNNPIFYMDPDGQGVTGDFYKADGTWIRNDGKDDKKVYVENASGTVTSNLEKLKGLKFKELSINSDKLSSAAGTAYAESSAYKMNTVTEDLKKELYAIAYVNKRNAVAYGAGTEKAKSLSDKTPEQRNKSAFHKTSVAAVLNAYAGGIDYSYGATMWDGKEQSLYPASNNNASQDGFELHMNTMGWSISDEHYATWKKNVGKEFKAPQQKASPQNYPKTSNRGAYNNKGKKCLKSTAVYGETIFWKQTCQ